jgi:hypothetical protein
MRRDTVSADRKQTVREAAQEWRDAEWIDKDEYKKIEKIYPDDRVRTGPAFRILFFILTVVAIMGFVATMFVLIDHETPVAFFALFAGIACWIVADYLIVFRKRRQGGIEAAFSLASILNILLGIGIILINSRWSWGNYWMPSLLLFLFLSFLAGAAGWNWGYWPYAAISALSLFIAMLRLPEVLWIIFILISYHWLVRGCDSTKLPPSIRKCSAAFLAVSLAGLYAAVNIFLIDQHSFDDWSHETISHPRWLFIILTAVVPLVIFAIGILRRRRLFFVLGFLLGVLSLITLRMYIHVAPPWIVLTGAGVLLLVAAVILRRFLNSGVNGERAGYTAAPLTERPEKHRGVEIVANMAAFTPSQSAAANPTEYQGGGGSFGGGGASGKF